MQFKTILLLLALCVAVGANAQTNEDVVDRVSRAVGVRLPDGYEVKVKEFAAKNELLKRKSAEDFTEQWIAGQMKTSWGIDRGNQLLFVWDAVYEQITKKNFYDGEDGNKQRLDDFEKVIDNIEACGKKYKQDYIAYMQQRSAEADRRSAEADRRLAISLHHNLAQMIELYQLRNSAFENEIKMMKEMAKKDIEDCKKNNIDYHALLPLEVQKFYDITPTNQQNTLTCEKAIVQLLNITLDEIVKLYNLYQKAPNAEREKEDIKSVIENCKKYNVDYKSKLTPEILKFYGVE